MPLITGKSQKIIRQKEIPSEALHQGVLSSSVPIARESDVIEEGVSNDSRVKFVENSENVSNSINSDLVSCDPDVIAVRQNIKTEMKVEDRPKKQAVATKKSGCKHKKKKKT
jgi:hypothetical protein